MILVWWVACVAESPVRLAPVALTRWSDTHELYLELDVPQPGHRFRYDAHVTRLADQSPVDRGALTLRLEQDGFPVESHTDTTIDEPGVFTAEAPAPREAGAYRLFVTFAGASQAAEWDLGTVAVGDVAPIAEQRDTAGTVRFAKEAQWAIPFSVSRASERPLAPSIQVAGVVRPSPDSTALVAAPFDGLVVWADTIPVVGRRVTGGDRLATLVPAGQAESWSRLQADLVTARVDRDLAGKELVRVRELVAGDLLPVRRLEEARARLEIAENERAATSRRLGALTGGTGGGMAIRAPASGVVVALGAGHGEAVRAGTPLVQVVTGEGVLIEARVHQRTPWRLGSVRGVTVMRGDWERPVDVLALDATVLTEQLVFDGAAGSAPLTVQVPGGSGLSAGDRVELEISVGEPVPRVVVPRSAVVEINATDVVFVQTGGESFSRRRVVLGARDTAHVEVREGVAVGERVVVRGGFDVHVASLAGALESHRH